MAEKKKSKEKERFPKEEVCEVFKIEKKGKEYERFSAPFKSEKIVENCGDIEEKPSDEKQIKEQNKILRNVLIGIGIFILFFIVGFYFMNSVKNFEYNNIKFDIIKEKKITFYHTSFPMTYENGEKAIYNAFLRKDPRKTGEISIGGKVSLFEMLVLNSSENFNCNGDGVIAIANFNNILGALGTKVVNDPNASCDKYGRYVFVNLQSGNETEIKNVGKNCYNFKINNCEILDVTERFLIEVLKEKNN